MLIDKTVNVNEILTNSLFTCLNVIYFSSITWKQKSMYPNVFAYTVKSIKIENGFLFSLLITML